MHECLTGRLLWQAFVIKSLFTEIRYIATFVRIISSKCESACKFLLIKRGEIYRRFRHSAQFQPLIFCNKKGSNPQKSFSSQSRLIKNRLQSTPHLREANRRCSIHIAQKSAKNFFKRGYISIFPQKISTVTITCFQKDLCLQVAL